ncbi:MAG: hypothetical protein R2783_05840 [Gelidibacter sp.]
MRLKLQVALVGILGIFVYNNALSQSKTKQKPLSIVVFDENVNEPLTAKELAQIEEVYGAETQASVLDRSQRIKDIKNILRNRVEIINAGEKDLSSFPKLSQVELFNDFMPNLTRDFSFNPENFNPLKYKFNFYSRNASIYWVDNTTYYIAIKSQHQ